MSLGEVLYMEMYHDKSTFELGYTLVIMMTFKFFSLIVA